MKKLLIIAAVLLGGAAIIQARKLTQQEMIDQGLGLCAVVKPSTSAVGKTTGLLVAADTAEKAFDIISSQFKVAKSMAKCISDADAPGCAERRAVYGTNLSKGSIRLVHALDGLLSTLDLIDLLEQVLLDCTLKNVAYAAGPKSAALYDKMQKQLTSVLEEFRAVANVLAMQKQILANGTTELKIAATKDEAKQERLTDAAEKVLATEE